ncbi:helix-turn-helix transcriptional regulator [Parasphaerochaeta coccoides]|uniref:Transcriptional regulator, AraC family n=1 Tax=Parasphaerochaeta coccoides (strain ATCC BAA-1237 / DSM 17374 / SPN1) TaxID=760011 RepID=F4GK98_PARC1|nr:AraC family transcriptional regulator [Parasphaerochaeta coccoides]AEC02294.1 transcriptional regulator, AraC family [Parasphaerochaeta coccoides DSM 17374]
MFSNEDSGKILIKDVKENSLLENATVLNILEWMSRDKAKRELKTCGMTLDLDKPLLLVASNIDKFSPRSNSHERFLMMCKVENMFISYLSRKFMFVHASDANKNMFWVLQPKGALEKSLSYCKHLLEEIQEHSSKSHALSISIVYDKFVPFEELHDKYRLLRSILLQISIQGEGQVLANSLFYQDRHIPLAEISESTYLNDLENMKNALISGDVDAVDAVLHDILYSQQNTVAIHSLRMYHSVCDIILSYIEDMGMSDSLLSLPSVFEIFHQYEDRAIFYDKVSALSRILIEQRKQLYSSRREALIHRINNFISANLSSDLSLQIISDTFYVNPSYLSRIYKQAIGHTVGEEITDRRMEMAKKLLLRMEYKVSHIAHDIGYKSAAYFTRVFKKREGDSPQVWRERNMENRLEKK